MRALGVNAAASRGDAENHIGRLHHVPVIPLDLVMDRIHKDEGIDTFQRTVLPCRDLRRDFLANFVEHKYRPEHPQLAIHS